MARWWNNGTVVEQRRDGGVNCKEIGDEMVREMRCWLCSVFCVELWSVGGGEEDWKWQ